MQLLWAVFQEVDIDGDGYISLPEFKKYITKRCSTLSYLQYALSAA